MWSLAAPVLATASASKLPWYAYLSYPGIALLLAVSAHRLAQAVSERSSIRSTLLAASVLVLVWRMPADRVWPAEKQYRGLAARLWEIACRDSRIVVIPGPGFQLPLRRDDACRETRFFIRSLVWRQSRSSSDPGSCRAILVNHLRDGSERSDVVELHRPSQRGVRVWLVDGCGGRLRERLTSYQIRLLER